VPKVAIKIKKLPSAFILLVFFLTVQFLVQGCGGKEEEAQSPQATQKEERELPAIVITEPRFTELDKTTSTTISLAGLSVKDLKSVKWENNRGGSGVARGTINWRVPEVTLQPGENIIKISAEDSGTGEIYTAQLTVTYEPAELLGKLTVNLDTIYIDEKNEVIAEIPITPNPKLNKNKMEIYRTYPDGKNMYLLGLLTDDGDQKNGDRVAGDNIWSSKFVLTRGKEGQIGLKRVGQTADELSKLWGLFDKDLGSKLSVRVSAYLLEADESFATTYSNDVYISVQKR